MKKVIEQINKTLAEICGWLLSLMIIFLCFDIISREAAEPVQWVAEMAVFVMMSAIYLGLSQCERLDKHVKVTALFERMPIRIQKIVRATNYAIMIPVVSILLWSAVNNLIYTYAKKVAIAGTVPLLLWPVRFVILIGIFFYWLQVIINFYDCLKTLNTSN